MFKQNTKIFLCAELIICEEFALAYQVTFIFINWYQKPNNH